MTRLHHVFSVASVVLLCAGMAWPAPDPKPIPPVQAPVVCQPAALLWLYGNPIDQWLILNYFPAMADCDKALAALGTIAGAEAVCLEVGVHPAERHPEYGRLSSPPVAK